MDWYNASDNKYELYCLFFSKLPSNDLLKSLNRRWSDYNLPKFLVGKTSQHFSLAFFAKRVRKHRSSLNLFAACVCLFFNGPKSKVLGTIIPKAHLLEEPAVSHQVSKTSWRVHSTLRMGDSVWCSGLLSFCPHPTVIWSLQEYHIAGMHSIRPHTA